MKTKSRKATLIHFVFVLRQVHRLFQTEFSTECNLAFPVSIPSTLSFSLRSSSSCLRLFPLLLVPYIISSVMCFRSLSIRKMWAVKLAFVRFISCRMFLWKKHSLLKTVNVGMNSHSTYFISGCAILLILRYPAFAASYFSVPLTFQTLAVTLRTTRFNIKKFYMVPTLRLCVLYGSQNKQ
jgi:hypothetical protein